MSSRDWITPLPPGYRHGERPAVGVIPCHGHDCNQYPLVRLDKRGKPYAACDSALGQGVRGCGRRYDFLETDVPHQALENAEPIRLEWSVLPVAVKRLLTDAWGVQFDPNNKITDSKETANEQTAEADEGRTDSDRNPEPVRTDAGNSEGNLEPEAGTDPGNSEQSDSERSGNGSDDGDDDGDFLRFGG